MCKACQPLLIFLMVIFYFHYNLAGQPSVEIDPCDLMIHGRDVPRDRYPLLALLEFPFYHKRLPVRFYLNRSIPGMYRFAAYAVAREWNRKANDFDLITIRDEIDDSDYNDRSAEEQSQAFKNVIYWLNNEEYESFTSRREERIMSKRAITEFAHDLNVAIPLVLIDDTDIFVHAEKNTFMEATRQILIQHLNRINVEYLEDMDTIELQILFLERLLNMNNDDFYNMIIDLMRDRQITLPTGQPEDIQREIIERISEEITQPLESFEDLRDLMLKEYSMDLTNISILDKSVLFKNTLLHEFGRALGLLDNNEPGSLMYSEIYTPPILQFPRDLITSWDIDDLATHGLSCSYDLERRENNISYPTYAR